MNAMTKPAPVAPVAPRTTETVNAQRLASVVPGRHEDFVALYRSFAEDETQRTNAPYRVDALVENPLPLFWGRHPRAPLTAALATLRTQVAEEALEDASVAWQLLRLDRHDGALYRPGGGGMRLTEHALDQLVGALGCGRGSRSVLGSVPPFARAHLYTSLLASSKRKVDELLTVRTGKQPELRDSMTGFVTRAARRLTRAIVTGRHAGTHYDDLSLAQVVERECPGESSAVWARAELGTESRAWVVVGTGHGLERTVSLSTSETGEARLSLRASARITALDAMVVSPRGVTITEEEDAPMRDLRTVELAAAAGRSDRNHTLPQMGTAALRDRHALSCDRDGVDRIVSGVRMTEKQRRVIAQDRVADSWRTAVQATVELAEQWQVALITYAPGMSVASYKFAEKWDAEVVATDLLDAVEAAGISLDDDKPALLKVLADDKRLVVLPHGSAAHIAAAYAVLASRGTGERDEKGQRIPFEWREAERLQKTAGRWVAAGWDKKAHSKLLGEL